MNTIIKKSLIMFPLLITLMGTVIACINHPSATFQNHNLVGATPSEEYNDIYESSGTNFTLSNTKNIIARSDKDRYSRLISNFTPSNGGSDTYHNGQIFGAQAFPTQIINGRSSNSIRAFTQYGYALGTTLSEEENLDYTNSIANINEAISLPANVINKSDRSVANSGGDFQMGFNLNEYQPNDGFLSSANFEKDPSDADRTLFTNSMKDFITSSPVNTNFDGGTQFFTTVVDPTDLTFIYYDIIHAINPLTNTNEFYFYEYTSTSTLVPQRSDKTVYNEEKPISVFGQFTKTQLITNTGLENFLTDDITNGLYRTENNSAPTDYTDNLFNAFINNGTALGTDVDFYIFFPNSTNIASNIHLDSSIDTIANPIVDNQLLNNDARRSMYVYNNDSFSAFAQMLYLSFLAIANGGITNGPANPVAFGTTTNFTNNINADQPKDPYYSLGSLPLFINVNAGRYYNSSDYIPIENTDVVSTSYCYPLFSPTLTVMANGKPFAVQPTTYGNANVLISLVVIIVIIVGIFVLFPFTILAIKLFNKKKSK